MEKANVLIIRKWFYDDTTVGELYINDVKFCYTLEDAVRGYGVKIDGKTAIAQGRYKCKLSMSSRFKRIMPMLYTEPNGYEVIKGGISFKGVRIHGGNTHLNTEGCVLCAYERTSDKSIYKTAESDLTKELAKYQEIEVVIINEIE